MYRGHVVETPSIQAVVLAAGKSTRFKAGSSKLVYPLCGKPLLIHALEPLIALNFPITVVVGRHNKNSVQEKISFYTSQSIRYVIQEQQHGTADAVLQSESTWHKDSILITHGDMPLLSSLYIHALYHEHKKSGAAISFMAADTLDPSGYGRVVVQDGGYRIVEEKECTDEQRRISLVNAGVYLVDVSFLKNVLSSIARSTVTNEFYLPELIGLATTKGRKVVCKKVPFDTVRGVNTIEQFWEVEQIKRAELIKQWMASGVYFHMPTTVHVDCNVVIGQGSTIGAGVQLLQGTIIGKKCMIDAYSVLGRTILQDQVKVYSHSVIWDAHIASQAEVGPFARLRNNVKLQPGVVVGNFVEMKKTVIGTNTKVKHLSYLGDSTVGSEVNIGAGTITCNHDGLAKHKTVIEDNAFIGSNTLLIAPIQVGSDAYTAAGSVITNDVKSSDLAIGRAQQVNKAGYAAKMGIKSVKAKIKNSINHTQP